MKHFRLILLAMLITAFSSTTFGQGSIGDSLSNSTENLGQIYLDMPLVTLPAQIQAYHTTGGFFPSYMNPGMENSLAYSTDLYTAAHFGLKKVLHFKNPFWNAFSQRMAVSLFDITIMQMPLGVS